MALLGWSKRHRESQSREIDELLAEQRDARDEVLSALAAKAEELQAVTRRLDMTERKVRTGDLGPNNNGR